MKAVIIGGGISGLANAHALSKNGFSVEIVERATGPRTEGYTIDFYGRGFDAAQNLGVLSAIEARGRKYREIRYVDARGVSKATIAVESVARAANGKYFSITRGAVEEALRTTLPDGVAIRFGTTVSEVDAGSAHAAAKVRLSDGDRISADLVLGCDGLHSPTRQLVTDASLRNLGFLAAAFSIRAPHIASQLGDSVYFSDTLNRQIGVYAAGPELASVFLVAPAPPQFPADRTAWVAQRLRGAGALTDWLAERVPSDAYLDVVAQTVAPQWHAGRVVIMGDAAHAVSLLAGQGSSLAIAGAEALGAEIAARPGDISTAIAEYERNWRPVVERAQASGRQLVNLFIVRRRWQQLLRRLLLSTARVPLLAPILASRIAVS